MCIRSCGISLQLNSAMNAQLTFEGSGFLHITKHHRWAWACVCFLFLGINFTRRALALDVTLLIVCVDMLENDEISLFATATTHSLYDLPESTLYCHNMLEVFHFCHNNVIFFYSPLVKMLWRTRESSVEKRSLTWTQKRYEQWSIEWSCNHQLHKAQNNVMQ